MPTEGEFIRASDLLQEAASLTRSLLDPVDAAMGPEVFSGGKLTKSVYAAIDRNDGDCKSLAGGMQRLAGECRSRARAVAAAEAEAAAFAAATTTFNTDSAGYDAALAAHNEDTTLPHPGRPPTAPKPPSTPPPWAEF